MRPIPPKLKKELDSLPRMHSCERRNRECNGRITWEHCWIYSGRQINETWAIIGLCEYHHLGEGLDKGKNRLISLKYATPKDLEKYPAVDWAQTRRYLEQRYARETSVQRERESIREIWEVPIEAVDGKRASEYRQELARCNGDGSDGTSGV